MADDFGWMHGNCTGYPVMQRANTAETIVKCMDVNILTSSDLEALINALGQHKYICGLCAANCSVRVHPGAISSQISWDKGDWRGWLHQGNAAGANFTISTCTRYTFSFNDDIASRIFCFALGIVTGLEFSNFSRQVNVLVLAFQIA